MSAFTPANKKLFFTRNDPDDQRLGDMVTALDSNALEGSLTVIAGYPDDEGIIHNGGRPGARQGPDSIRDRLYRMTPPAFSNNQLLNLRDAGNLKTNEYSLKQRHQEISRLATEVLSVPGNRWIGLGGGHDFGFPDGEAFLNAFGDSGIKPLVINFDAHLDVRPLISDDKISSGTPFYRLLSQYKDGFDFIEVGLQPFCNSKAHLQWLKSQGGHYLTMQQIRETDQSLCQQILGVSGIKPQNQPCFLSVDIDVFSTAHAPGCSQSWPSGMTPKEFFPCFKELCNIFSIKALGVYEVSPPLDRDQQTAKLAAEIIYSYLYL